MRKLARPRFHSILMLIILSVLGGGSLVQAQSQLILGFTVDIDGIDPHIYASVEMGAIVRNIYDTLIYRDPETLEFVPGLATSWEISEDEMIYTFHLREDVVFHDDTPFNAQAVAANLDRILSDATASQKARFLLGPLERYEVVDNFTIRLIMTQQYSALLDALSQPYLAIASPTALNEFAEDVERYQFHQVGSGPYILEEYLPGDRVVIRRNPTYNWGPAFITNAAGVGGDTIEFRFFTDRSRHVEILQNKRVDILIGVQPEVVFALASDPEIQIFSSVVPGQSIQLVMNTQQPPTDNEIVRQALIFATNRNIISDTIFGGLYPIAWGPLTTTTLYYDTRVVGTYSYDVEQAQTLLTTAGYTDENEDGYIERGGEPLELTILVPTHDFLPDLTEVIAEQWRSLGIRVNLQLTPFPSELANAIEEGGYNLVFSDFDGIDPIFLNTRFISAFPGNWSRYEDQELDRALINATLSLDAESRTAGYAQAQAIIANEALVLPIVEPVQISAHQSDITNLTFDAYGWYPILSNVVVP